MSSSPRGCLPDHLAAPLDVFGDSALGGVQDDQRPIHSGLSASIEQEVDHRPAGQWVEDLRLLGSEAGAEAGG